MEKEEEKREGEQQKPAKEIESVLRKQTNW